MNKLFYRKIAEMANDAIAELAVAEKTGDFKEAIKKIKTVVTPCLDGKDLSSSIKSDIPLEHQYTFQNAILSLNALQAFHGGSGKNSHIEKPLKIINSMALELSSKSYSNISVFYSWQAGLPNKTNRGLIKTCLEKAIKEINKEIIIDARIDVDLDTSNTPGSPDILHTILNKIDKSSVFIADVTLVNKTQPNSNVMFELGYAIKAIGDSNIIMMFNDVYGNTKDLPFDLGFKRQMIYSCSEDEDDISRVREPLTKRLKNAIIQIINSDEPY